MKRASLLFLALGALAAGCGSDEGDIPTEGTILEFSRAGGIAFSVYEVEVDADGSAVARFGSNPEDLSEEEFELADNEISELRTILEENPISELPDPRDAACADCFEYIYEYGGDRYETADVSEPIAALSELDAFLADLPIPEDQANGG